MDPTPSIGTHSPAASRRFPIYRYSSYWFVIASATFVISTIVAVAQTRRPRDPYDLVRLSTIDGWTHAIEPKHEAELDQIQGDLKAIWIDAVGGIWVAGNSGTVARSTDGGDNWAQLSPGSEGPTSGTPSTTGEVVTTETTSTTAPAATTSTTATTDTASTTASGLSALVTPSAELAAIIGPEPKPRSEVTKEVWDYIKNHGLQDQINKRMINADDKLRVIFGGRNQVSMFEMTALVNKHLSVTVTPDTSGTSTTSGTTQTRHETSPQIERDFFELIPSAHAQGTVPAPASPSYSLPRNVDFIDFTVPISDLTGLAAVTSYGQIWLTSDGGATWRLQENPLQTPRQIPYRFADFDIGAPRLIVARDGYAYARFDAEQTMTTVFDEDVNAILRTASGYLGFANNGLVRFFESGPRSTIEAPVRADLYGATSVGDRIIIVGAHGTILEYRKGSWTVRKPPTTADLHALWFVDDMKGYVVGKRGVVLETTNGGRTFRHLTREWDPPTKARNGLPIPPPWYFLLNAFVTIPALAIATRARPRDASTPMQESVADLINSDQPLEKGQPDAMNLNAIALAISRFLRNENTVPPLTIAITGEWGSGKSSLMNLLKADLSEFGFRPVWFNAWHHQKEEHLLASLLQSIRLQALPRWWRPENFFFRARLIWIRGWKHRVNALLLLLLIALGLGYDAARHEHDGPLEPIGAGLAEAFRAPVDLLVEAPKKLGEEFALIASLLGIVVAAYKGLSAFGMNPVKLVASVSSSAKVQDLNAQMSFRHKFASEFHDVTEALGPRSLLIFIDDLDRCQPDSVNEVLEAVNFLMTAGSCYIVLGIDRDRVERYLKVSFKEASENEPDFARNYLDKLINIEVPVPPIDDAQSVKLLTPPRQLDEPSRRERATRIATRALAFWPLVAAVLLSWATFEAGKQLSRAKPDDGAATASAATPRQETVGAAARVAATGGDVPSDPPARVEQPGIVAQGTPRVHLWMFPWAVLVLLPLGGVAWWLITRKPDLVVHDSADFVTALQLWQPFIASRHRTPRALKRFMNRLRYLAMRQRPQHESQTFWRALHRKALATPVHEDATSAKPISEPTLVALASIYYLGRAWLDYSDMVDPPKDVAEDLWRRFNDIRGAHKAKFQWDLASRREDFLRILADVRVN